MMSGTMRTATDETWCGSGVSIMIALQRVPEDDRYGKATRKGWGLNEMEDRAENGLGLKKFFDGFILPDCSLNFFIYYHYNPAYTQNYPPHTSIN